MILLFSARKQVLASISSLICKSKNKVLIFLYLKLVSKKRKGIGNLNILNPLSPSQLYLHQMCSATFILFILPFLIFPACLCFFLLTYLPHSFLLHWSTLLWNIPFSYLLSFFFLIALFYYILTKFHGNLCYSTVNIPGHGIQSLSLSTEKVEDMNAQSWRAKWGWWEVKVLVSSFVT